jgi:hypothetical protein
MQIAERDARNATELKAQIGELQKAIEAMSRQINIRQVTPGDEEQTRLLDDMKDMQFASVSLQRRATLRLDFLTALSEETRTRELSRSERLIGPTKGTVPEPRPLLVVNEDEDVDVSTTPSDLLDSRHITQLHPTPSKTSVASLSIRSTSSTDRTLEQSQGALSAGETLPGGVTPRKGMSSLSSQEFEASVSSLLSSAPGQEMGAKKPYSEKLITMIAELLTSVGKPSWSKRPRTYLVLRLINEVTCMDDIILDGFKDIDFPYTDATVPQSIKEVGAERVFLQAQRCVLSEKSADLVRGGRHRHLGIVNPSKLHA